MSLDSVGLGTRVAQARQRSGLTQEDLARASGLDRSALAKIENGTRRLTALELARIADAVGERIEWFVDEPVPAIVSHRNVSDPGEPSPRVDEAIERVVRAVEFVAQHDSSLHGLLRTSPGLTLPATPSEVEEMATRARDLLGVDHGEPLHELSTKLLAAGVLTFVVDLGAESADAGSVQLRTGAVALVNGTLRTGRRRLALAHEFGHILIADPYTVDWRIDTSTVGVRERSIDRFARALLLPEASLADRWRMWSDVDGGGDIRDAAVRVASHFRVDMSTLARRLLDLEIITSATAARVRTFKTERVDIVEHDLVVADELPAGEIPRPYEAAVLRLFTSETVSDVRTLDLLLDTWDASELPDLDPRHESEIWQFVS